MTFVASAVAFGGAGHFLDLQLDSTPAFLLVGLLIGFVGGFVHLLSRIAPDLLPFGKPPSKDSSGSDVDPADDDSGS